MSGEHPDLSHLDAKGAVHMVDVGQKPVTARRAVAAGRILTRPEVVRMVVDQRAPKGDVLAVARVAAIMAAKRTSEWIPLCHPLPLSHVSVEIEPRTDQIQVTVVVETTAPTGVEMEALTAVSAALLTLYDMLKGQDRAMTLTDIQVMEKAGGRSGHFIREKE